MWFHCSPQSLVRTFATTVYMDFHLLTRQFNSPSSCTSIWKKVVLKKRAYLYQLMKMKGTMCIAYIQVMVVVGVANDGSLSSQHHPNSFNLDSFKHHFPDSRKHHPSDSLGHRLPNSNADIQARFSTGKQHLSPHNTDVKGPDNVLMSRVGRNKEKKSMHMCGLCPASEVIAPCTVSLYL